MQTVQMPAKDNAAAPQGHDEKMAEKFDNANAKAASMGQPQAEQPPAESRPEWLPEKFKSPEDLAKAYEELSALMRKGEHKKPEAKDGGADPKADETPKADDAPKADEKDPNEPTPDDAEKAVTAAGLDFDAMSTRFAEKGELPEDDFVALEKAGIKRELVEAYIEGQKAIAAQQRAESLAEFGGEKAYMSMVQWAAKALSPADVEAYNKVVSSGDVAQTKIAIAGLKARYEAANGSEPALLDGGADTSSDGYASRAEMTRDMADPRYKKDPAFRAQVERKVANATFL